jgi:hypothetical protein
MRSPNCTGRPAGGIQRQLQYYLKYIGATAAANAASTADTERRTRLPLASGESGNKEKTRAQAGIGTSQSHRLDYPSVSKTSVSPTNKVHSDFHFFPQFRPPAARAADQASTRERGEGKKKFGAAELCPRRRRGV